MCVCDISDRQSEGRVTIPKYVFVYLLILINLFFLMICEYIFADVVKHGEHAHARPTEMIALLSIVVVAPVVVAGGGGGAAAAVVVVVVAAAAAAAAV